MSGRRNRKEYVIASTRRVRSNLTVFGCRQELTPDGTHQCKHCLRFPLASLGASAHRNDIFHLDTSGFTLMEVLIAIAILAIVMTIVYGSFVQTRKVIDRAEGAVDELRGVRTALHRITSDSSMAFIEEEDDSTFFVGTDDYTGGYPNDSIDFTSFSNRLRNKDAKESDQMEVGYYLKRDFEGRGALMKREKRRIDKNPMYGGKTYEISEEIVGLNFRYLDEDGAWRDSWDSRVESPATIPVAVEIIVTVRDNSGTERSYKTIAEIPLGRRS